MSMLTRWKVVLALIATFAADALTGGLSTGCVIKDAVRRVEQPRQPRSPLQPEQANKMRSLLIQMDNELSNPRSLDLGESDGIFSRAKDRMDPIVAPN
jgi:hypothetical protein